MPIVDSLLPKSNNNSNIYYDYTQNNNFLLSPSSSSNSILQLKNSHGGQHEEISTIFVVGFPENMLEREFQNMFMFSPGFEAATLKVSHNSNSNIDDDNRKQIIGFAKFRTRSEALDAKEVLNGRKIDQEKGSVLKAEVAKKNLHTNLKKEKTVYEAFHSVNENTIPPTIPNQSHHRSLSLSYSNNNSHSLDSNNSLFGRMGNKKAASIYPTPTLSSPFLFHKLQQYNNSNMIPPNTPTTTTHNNEDHLLSQLIVSSSASTPIFTMDNSSTSTDYYAYTHQGNGNFKNMDQNPPCNTLYVGNLPSNTNQQELLSLFSKRLGYKRLVYRKSNNGPMCFVEFEDVTYATLALKELNGHLLSNSIKGGIRLSYSKNPLGVRQNMTTASSIHL